MKKFLTLIIFIFFFNNILFFVYSQKKIFSSTDERSRSSRNLVVRVDQIIAGKFPKLEVYVTVVDGENKPILSLIKGNFDVLVDGKSIGSKFKIEGFQYTEDPIEYAVITSANGMMAGETLAEQQKAAIFLFEQLRPQDRMSYYTFGEEVKSAFEHEKKDEKLLEKITETELLGFNPHLYDVLVQVARRVNETKIKRKVIIIMTDGREIGSKYTEEQVLRVIDDINIPVYSVGIRLMAGQNLHRINGISEHTGGGYIFTPEVSDIPKGMGLINDQIRLGYVFNCKIPGIKGDDQHHQIEVKVNYKGEDSSFFKNFFARRVPVPLWLKIVIIAAIILVLAVLILSFILIRRSARKRMGISKRKCPVCKRRMKDDWDECLFCKYLPPKKKKKKKGEFEE